VAAGLEEDAEKAYQHALAARRLAARVGVVREASGIAAYRAGKWAEALAELRAARRLTGRESYLPLMADSERALGRLDRALDLVRSPESAALDRATRIELRIVESGIRRDQGLPEAAVVALQLPELSDRRNKPGSARLFYAYADALADAGREDEARDWFGRAAAADLDGETDAAERFEEFDQIVFDDLEGSDEASLDGEGDELDGEGDELDDEELVGGLELVGEAAVSGGDELDDAGLGDEERDEEIAGREIASPDDHELGS
jgi:tetratricopeptide (TPR) repeat protein